MLIHGHILRVGRGQVSEPIRGQTPRRFTEQIKKSVLEFGFTVPALIDEGNRVLAGHGRLEAAKLAGLSSIPCVRVTHMSEAQKRAYVIADNKLALNAGWNDELLAAELHALVAEHDVVFQLLDTREARWLQWKGPKQNPWFGSEMPECGTEVPL